MFIIFRTFIVFGGIPEICEFGYWEVSQRFTDTDWGIITHPQKDTERSIEIRVRNQKPELDWLNQFPLQKV